MEEGCFPEKKSFTRMQIKPKILHGLKPKMTYIKEVKNTINPKKILENILFLKIWIQI